MRKGGPRAWQKYYEVKSEDSRFKTDEEAMAAWESSRHLLELQVTHGF